MVNNWFDLIWGKLIRWEQYLVKMLPNFVMALLAMLLFIFLARIIRRFSARIMHRLSKSESVGGLTSALAYTLVLAIGLMIALKILKLEQAVTSLLAGVGIIGLALGFAFQDLTSNFISGAFIVFKRPFDVGHIVDTNGFVGRIQDIQLRATTIQTLAGLHVIIPNKDIFQKPIINYSLTDSRRVELEFFIPNTLDLQATAAAVLASLQSLEQRSAERDGEAYYSAIEEGKTKLYVCFWTTRTNPDAFLAARHQAILAVTATIKKMTPATT